MDSDALVAAMAQLSRAATDDFAVEEMLRSLCDAAAEALAVDGAGVMITEFGRNRFVHATSADVEPLELLQELLQCGPCADSLARQAPVVVTDLQAAGPRWQDFSDLSARLQLRSVLATPLLSRGVTWGILDLYRRRSGDWTSQELQAAETLADIAVSYIVMAHDRDLARAAQTALAHQAMHDPLTQLPNRALLFDRLDHALAGVHRCQAGIAVLFLDLDHFKVINDTFGHTVADGVLLQVAHRLTVQLRAGDTVARFAGDEFVVILEGLPQSPVTTLVDRVNILTARLQESMRAPMLAGGTEIAVSMSIGVAITTDSMTAHELLADADTAMYAAKAAGRGRAVVRDHTASSGIGYAKTIERSLFHALERDELQVHYQPIFHAGDLRVVAVEALLRWAQPGKAVLPAATFIDVAERSGLIVKIGQWVVRETCAQMRVWQDALGEAGPTTAYVNLSSRELVDPRLAKTIAEAVSANGLHPQQLGLEIVEEDLADPALAHQLRLFREAGHALSVDDFGTGYSSLSRLIDLPINLVKIDKTFVAGIPEDVRRNRMIEGILAIAANLGIEVVAEGVENEQQSMHLQAAGVQLLQGFFLGVPESGDDLTAAWTR